MPLPSYLVNRRHRAQAVALAEASTASIGAPPIPRISIRNNHWTVYDAKNVAIPIQTLYLDAIIIDANPATSKIYYKDKFDPTATTFKPPDCFSDDGVTPSTTIATPVHTHCASCPMNVFGSAVSERPPYKKMKACSDRKKLAVLLPNPLQTPTGPVQPLETPFQLILPFGAQKLYKEYCAHIDSLVDPESGEKIGLSDCVTRMSFDDQAPMGTVLFEGMDLINEKWAGIIDDVLDEGLTDVLIGRNIDTPQIGYTPAAPVSQIAEQAHAAPQMQQSGLAAAHPQADQAGRLALEAEAARVTAERAAEEARQASLAATQAQAAETSKNQGTRAPRKLKPTTAPPPAAPAEPRAAPFGANGGGTASTADPRHAQGIASVPAAGAQLQSRLAGLFKK